jgi:hypothetical protein
MLRRYRDQPEADRSIAQTVSNVKTVTRVVCRRLEITDVVRSNRLVIIVPLAQHPQLARRHCLRNEAAGKAYRDQ